MGPPLCKATPASTGVARTAAPKNTQYNLWRFQQGWVLAGVSTSHWACWACPAARRQQDLIRPSLAAALWRHAWPQHLHCRFAAAARTGRARWPACKSCNPKPPSTGISVAPVCQQRRQRQNKERRQRKGRAAGADGPPRRRRLLAGGGVSAAPHPFPLLHPRDSNQRVGGLDFSCSTPAPRNHPSRGTVQNCARAAG